MGKAGGAIGSVAGALGDVGAYFAANRAARANARNQREGRAFYQSGQDQALGRLDPYANTGEQALSPLTGLLLGKQYNPETGAYDTISQDQRMNLFQTSPGYQFRVDQAQKAIQNSQAAKGNLLSGGAMKELSQYNQGLASDEYGNYINQLTGLANSGQTAATNQAGLQIGGLSSLTGLYMGGTQSAYQAQKYQNMAELSKSLGNRANQYGQQESQNASQMAQLGMMMGGSDINLKENIELVGASESGIPIYHFDYKDKKYGEGRYQGTMAQDIMDKHPESVSKKDGYFMVDYSKLDVTFKRIA